MRKKTARFNELLVKSIDEAVTELLGEKGRDTLFQHLAEQYDITRDEIPYRLDSLYASIEQTLGDKASRILDREIAKFLSREISVPLPDTRDYTLQTYLLKVRKLVA